MPKIMKDTDILKKYYTQGYEDALADFSFSCSEGKTERWDRIVLTAANEKQAGAYLLQIEERRKQRRIPVGTLVDIVPDWKDERIGSGGATLNVIRHIIEKDGWEKFIKERILIIHSGGDSKRIPQYSACGKLFAPIPRILPGGFVSSTFDELLIIASGIPARIGTGIMIFPGDQQLLFNPLQIDLLSCDAAGLSIKAPAEEGAEHGVYLQGELSSDRRNNNVARFLHKLSVESLYEVGAVDQAGNVDIDTGCIWLGSKVAGAIARLIMSDSGIDEEKFGQYVNDRVRLNFYSDFVFPMSEAGSMEEYLGQTPENLMSDELVSCREEIWKTLNPFQISLVKVIPAKFIHFGTTHEMYDLFVRDIKEYEYLGWGNELSDKECGTVINSVISPGTVSSGDAFVENCVLEGESVIGRRAVLSNVDLSDDVVPDDMVLSGIILKDGRNVCRIYGRNDNPKEKSGGSLMGGTLADIILKWGIDRSAVWSDEDESIWDALIYPVTEDPNEAVKEALALYKIFSGDADRGEIERWLGLERTSMHLSFEESDVSALIHRKNRIKSQLKLNEFYRNIASGIDASEAIDGLFTNSVRDEIVQYTEKISDKADVESFPLNVRLYLTASDVCRRLNLEGEELPSALYEDKAYGAVCQCIIDETLKQFDFSSAGLQICCDEAVAELPVRVNFAGGPSDAAPYCLEHGGTMMNASVLLKGKKPVKAVIKKLEDGIWFKSENYDKAVRCSDLDEIRNCSNLQDPFALHKAVLMASGIIPIKDTGESLEEFCERIGGGFIIETRVDVPKGSGLGTSSILSAAVIRALDNFFGRTVSDDEIYAKVFLAEQLMGAGGGWQDQVGGLTNGIKFFTTQPGAYQKIEIEYPDPDNKILDMLDKRFVLIFSGQRRLARNVLREQMNQCIRNDKSVMHSMDLIQENCAVMRFYLLKENIDEFANCLSRHFELLKSLDDGATNAFIDYIFDVCDDLIAGKSICGAGGGGFLQVVLKKGISKEDIRKRVADCFGDCGVEVWDCELC